VSTTSEVADAIGRTITGQPRTVPGTPEQTIGRTGRIDCYYGLADGQPVGQATVAIGVATYTDGQAAARRVVRTVDDERAAGANVSSVAVGQEQGTLLVGETITLVVARQSTTVVVTLAKDLLSRERASEALARLANRALSFA